jgi:flagellar biosynthesis regulator FlaF
MADSSATVIIIFVIFLLMAGGGTAAWYFLYYKPRQGPSPAPAYVSPPTPTIIYTPSTVSAPSPEEDGEDGEDDYDPIELGEVLSPAGSPSAAFSLALWRAKMKKTFGKNRTVLEKRLKVLEDARDADNEQSGTVPSEHFEDAIKYIKDLIKKLPKAPAPKAKGPFVFAKWKTSVVAYFEKKTIEDVQKSIDELKAAKKAGAAVKNDVPRAKYADAIKWLEAILKKKEQKLEETFDIAKWKVRAKNELKGKRPAVVTGVIDMFKNAQTKKLATFDGVPRSKYNEAIKWLRVLETETKKPATSKKFNLAAWKTATQKKLKNKSKQEIQSAITRFENSTAAVHDGVPKASKGQAITFLKGLKAKAKK